MLFGHRNHLQERKHWRDMGYKLEIKCQETNTSPMLLYVQDAHSTMNVI